MQNSFASFASTLIDHHQHRLTSKHFATSLSTNIINDQHHLCGNIINDHHYIWQHHQTVSPAVGMLVERPLHEATASVTASASLAATLLLSSSSTSNISSSSNITFNNPQHHLTPYNNHHGAPSSSIITLKCTPNHPNSHIITPGSTLMRDKSPQNAPKITPNRI